MTIIICEYGRHEEVLLPLGKAVSRYVLLFSFPFIHSVVKMDLPWSCFNRIGPELCVLESKVVHSAADNPSNFVLFQFRCCSNDCGCVDRAVDGTG